VSKTTYTPDRFTWLPDDQTLGATIVALEEHGTLEQTAIADAINGGDRYDSARTKMFSLDLATQAKEMKAIGGQPDYALGSVHAVTRDGTPDRIHIVFVRQLVGF
jgi:hypothetical protein